MHELHQEVTRLLGAASRELQPEMHIDLTHIARRTARWDHSAPVPAQVAPEVYKAEAAS